MRNHSDLYIDWSGEKKVRSYRNLILKRVERSDRRQTSRRDGNEICTMLYKNLRNVSDSSLTVLCVAI